MNYTIWILETSKGFAEFAAYRGLCRFNNCRHLHGLGCALIKAEQEGKIDARRLKLLLDITSENLKPSV